MKRAIGISGAGPQRLRVLVAVRWPLGGIRTFMRYSYGALAGQVQLTLVATVTHEWDSLAQNAREMGAELICGGYTGRDLARTVFSVLRQRRHDVIHSHGFSSALSAYGANLLFNKPHMMTVHGIVEKRFLNDRLGWLKSWLLHFVVRRLDMIHAVSRDIRDHLLEEMPSLQNGKPTVQVVENGIRTDWFRGCREGERDVRQALGIGPDDYLFGFLGRLMPQKGFDILIEAMAKLQASQVRCKVLVAATGDYLQEYQKEIELQGLGSKFAFLPFQADVRPVFRSIDALVMPSRWEAWGILASEALCSGLPVIGTNCIGLREALSGTSAVIIPPEDADTLAAAMHSMATDQHIAERFQKGVERAVELFSVETKAERLFGLMSGLAS